MRYLQADGPSGKADALQKLDCYLRDSNQSMSFRHKLQNAEERLLVTLEFSK